MKKPLPIGYVMLTWYLAGWALIMVAALVISGP